MLDFLWYLIIGLVIGAVAKLLMPGKDPGGCIITTLLGICGAMIAGAIARFFGLDALTGFGSFVASVLGALLLLFLYRIFLKKKG